MLRIHTQQVDAFRVDAFEARAAAFTDALRADFAAELAHRDRAALRGDVLALMHRHRDLGFSDGAHLYRLVAWGLFLGADFLTTEQDGALLKIAREDAPEADRFQRIRRRLLDDALAKRAAEPAEDPLDGFDMAFLSGGRRDD